MPQFRIAAISVPPPVPPAKPEITVIPPHDKLGIIKGEITRITDEFINNLPVTIATWNADNPAFTTPAQLQQTLLQSVIEQAIQHQFTRPILELEDAYLGLVSLAVTQSEITLPSEFGTQAAEAAKRFAEISYPAGASKLAAWIAANPNQPESIRLAFEKVTAPMMAPQFMEPHYEFHVLWPNGEKNTFKVADCDIPNKYFGNISYQFMINPQEIKCGGTDIEDHHAAAKCLGTFTADASDTHFPICPCGGELTRTDIKDQAAATMEWIQDRISLTSTGGKRKRTMST